MSSRPVLLTAASIACVLGGFYTGTCAWRSPGAPMTDSGRDLTSATTPLAMSVPSARDLAEVASTAVSTAAQDHLAAARRPSVPTAAKAAAVRLPAMPASVVARRIGLLPDDPRAALVAEWVSTKLGEDHRLMDALDSAADRDKPARMSEFNAATSARRLQLLSDVGSELAAKVVETYCLYRFDLENGTWFRIDVHGNRLPFKHDDDDIWQNGERSVRRFHNHARN